MSFLAELIAKILVSFGLGWLQQKQNDANAKEVGRSEQAEADIAASKIKQDKIDEVAVNPPDDDEVMKRLKDHSA